MCDRIYAFLLAQAKPLQADGCVGNGLTAPYAFGRRRRNQARLITCIALLKVPISGR